MHDVPTEVLHAHQLGQRAVGQQHLPRQPALTFCSQHVSYHTREELITAKILSMWIKGRACGRAQPGRQ